jgi:hypothetical protein
MRRVDNPITGGSSYAIDVPPVPMDMMPGIGKIGNLLSMESPRSTLLPGAERPVTFGLPKVESILPKGLERNYGGSGQSMEALIQTVNRQIYSSTRGGEELSMDAAIQKSTVTSRVTPAIRASEELNILPSKTSFKPSYAIDQAKFNDIFAGIVESENRIPSGKQFPTGMQMDYLRDALKQRKQSVYTTQQPVQVQVPVTLPGVYNFPVKIQPRVTLQPQVQVPITIPVTIPVKAPTQIKTPIQTQVPVQVQKQPQIYTPTVFPIPNAVPSRNPDNGKKYIPTPDIPRKPQPERPYIPRTTPRGIDTPSKPVPPRLPIIPIPPFGMGFGAGVTGSGFSRKRRRNFLEVFRMGLDIGGPVMTAPKGMKPPVLKRSSIPGGKQKIKLSRRKR